MAGLDAWSVRVEWNSASTVNGPIERYMLYISTDDQSLGSVVYNSSQLLLFHTLTNLTAATQYFIRLAVGSRTKLVLTDNVKAAAHQILIRETIVWILSKKIHQTFVYDENRFNLNIFSLHWAFHCHCLASENCWRHCCFIDICSWTLYSRYSCVIATHFGICDAFCN